MNQITIVEPKVEKQNQSDEARFIDPHGRKISYLRVSVTDRCNLRCFYCRPNGIFEALPHKDILTYEEMYRLIKIGADLGIKKVRITGGEPLVRNGVVEFITELTKIKGLEDISLTTNGIYLNQHLEKLYSGGIKRINISMDTLKKDRYREITGADRFQEVWESIQLAEKINFQPVKINMVVIKGINDDEVKVMALLTMSHPYHIRFIEYMPVGIQKQKPGDYFVSSLKIKQQIEQIGKLIPISSHTFDGPAKMYQFENAPGKVGFISAMSNHFCGTCNRLRLTAAGYLKPCLLSNIKYDIKGPLRSGFSDNELADLFIKTINSKPMEHQLDSTAKSFISDQMSNVGG